MYRMGQISNEQRQIALAELTQRQNYELALRQQNWTQQYQQGQLNVEQQRARVEEMYRMGQISNEQRQIALAELTQRQNYELALNQQSIEQQRARVEEMYRMGQISNEQRQIALAELTQRQNYLLSLRQQQLAEQVGLGNLDVNQQRLVLEALSQSQLQEYRMQQLAQEAALQREQMLLQQRLAAMQAYGRAQAPNVRWTRTWS
jgi:hypothetical protein